MKFRRIAALALGLSGMGLPVAVRAQAGVATPPQPPMIPSITGTLTYAISKPGRPGGNVEIVHIDRGRRLRVGGVDESLGYTIVTFSDEPGKAGQEDWVLPDRRQYMKLTIDKQQRFQFLLPLDTNFRYLGVSTENGVACTKWGFNDGAPATFCMATDGVLLRLDQVDPMNGPQSTRLISRVDGGQADVLFTLPPGYAEMGPITLTATPDETKTENQALQKALAAHPPQIVPVPKSGP